ncbi:MAG TPA: amidase, partial [Acetobacteraceae bacterium]|nr:amidase [Acetobacteraceae bacterium]
MAIEPARRTFLAGAAAAAIATEAMPARAAQADMAYRRATDLIEALVTKTVSSRELVDAAIARIEAHDSKINAVVVRDFAVARAAADAADAALARGERRPLLGLPMTVKEQFNIAGLPTTWGQPAFKNWQPTEDALVVARLKAAGAVILGKTNVPLNLSDWQSYNDIYGTTNNPWDLTRTPGGSSGGSAAALAAGYVALELGSDIGGSLRIPAHFCGVYAHKPSLDLVPQRGGGPPETPAIPFRGDLAVTGPMARSATDLALELGVISGPDERWDGIGYQLALPPARHAALKDFRVLVLDSHPLCPTASSITGALNRLAERLGKTGCSVLRTSPLLPDLARTARIYVELLSAFRGVDLPADERQRVQSAASALHPGDESIRAWRLRGLTTNYLDWVGASRVRAGLTQRWQALFRDVDVVLCPPMPSLAFSHDHSPGRTRRLDIDGKSVTYGDQIVWISIATL